jgi:hypothetical protein
MITIFHLHAVISSGASPSITAVASNLLGRLDRRRIDLKAREGEEAEEAEGDTFERECGRIHGENTNDSGIESSIRG